MEPVTLRWVRCELTIAMDLYSRCITGLRLSPVSTKSVDAALVLFEALRPGSRQHTSGGLLPYAGLPEPGRQPGTGPPGWPGWPRRPSWSTTARSTCPITC